MSKTTARYIILALLMLMLFSLTQLSGLRFDYDFESLFSTDDPELVYYQAYREKFGSDNDYLLLGFAPEGGLFNAAFLDRIDRLTVALSALPEITAITRPTDLQYAVKTPLGMVLVPYLHPDSNSRLKRDSVSLASDAGLMGLLLSHDLSALRLIIRHQPLDLEDGRIMVRKMEQILKQQGFEQYYLAGKAKAQVVFVESIQRDFKLFLGIGTLLIIVVMWWIYRSVPLIIISIAIIGLVLAFTFCGMALFKVPIDIMGALIPMILVIVSMSDIIHFSTRYRDELSRGNDEQESLMRAWQEVGQATLLTSVTTAIGFFTLLTASSAPISQMGLVTGCGVLIAYGLTFTLLPAVITLWSGFIGPVRQKVAPAPTNVTPGLNYIMQHGTKIQLVFGGFALLAAVGLSRLELDAKLIHDLPSPSSIKTSFVFFEEKFGGSKPWELSVMLQDSTASVYDPEVVHELTKLDEYIRSEYGVSSLISPLTPVRLYENALSGNYSLPDKATYTGWGNQWEMIRQKMVPSDMVVQLGSQTRFSGFVPDYGSKVSSQKDQALREFIATQINPEIIAVHLTGTTYLIDRSHEFISFNLMQGLLLAVFTIAVILGVIYRQLHLVLISLLCNLLPLLLIAGVLGWLAVPVSLSNAIIFAVSFGIAVDDTVHFLSKYNQEVSKGLSVREAVASTLKSTGKAIIFSSLILIAGFSLFIFSSFQTTFSIGLLISLTLLFAVAIDLYLLPSLLLLKSKKEQKS